MIDQERLVNEFISLVKIDSLSKKEGEIAAHLVERLKDLGLEVVVDEKSCAACNSQTGNLIGKLKATKEGIKPVLFAAHMDTVTPGENIKPQNKDGIIYSSGDTILGADDKSGIAAVMEALRHICEEKIPHGDIEVVFTIGEEIGLMGARHLNYSLITAKIGYVLDSGGDPGIIINQGPAHKNLKAIIYGKSAHAGANPETGISSIQVAARAIDRMKLLRIDEETTANWGIISGGKATNIVCDQVVLEGEARSLSAEKLELQVKHMVECLQEACKHFGARLECTPEDSYPSFYIAKDHPVIELAQKAARKIGLKTDVASTGGGSDVHFFNRGGVATVNLATGMNKVHTVEEEIKIIDLVNTARLVAAIIETAAE